MSGLVIFRLATHFFFENKVIDREREVKYRILTQKKKEFCGNKQLNGIIINYYAEIEKKNAKKTFIHASNGKK
jgi:hypothetical protein